MAVKVYVHPIEPEKYAWFTRRPFRAVTRGALGGKVQFTSLRSFPSKADENIRASDTGAHPPLSKGGLLAHIEETVDMYVNHFKLGRVLWPVYPTLFAGNFKDVVDLCAKKGLYLYDFWGFVPGSQPSDESIWGEYEIPEDADAYMRETLGDHFLGYDNGEQDGRYVHARARQQAAIAPTREAQYAVFQAYFQKLNDSMRNHTVTLASLTFLPYFAKEGNTIMIGAETAQALPGNNMWFAFIRGAGKQYGLLYYGNASVWNRWGYKDYIRPDKTPDTTQGYEMGQFAGTSLSLLKKLIYNQYMYGCDILGFESSWFTSREAVPGEPNTDHSYVVSKKCHLFTPIGRIQQKCAEFVEENGLAGVMHAPVAMLLDFHAGWVPPRHLYSKDVYKVWGCLPYAMGDYQTHCLFSMLFPHYEDAGYYRSEQGFETATPYGEIADVLMSDVTNEVLSRYSVALLTRGVKLDHEVIATLTRFVERGGTLIGFAGSVNEYPDALPLFGAKALRACEDGCFAACAELGATISGSVLSHKRGEGETRLILHEHGLEATGEALSAKNAPNEPISQPYRLRKDAEAALAKAYGEVQLLRVNNPALQYLTSVREDGELTFMVASSAPQAEKFDILSEIGEIESLRELPTFDDAEAQEEFLPLLGDKPGEPCRAEGAYTIQPGCARLFRVRVKQPQVRALPEANPERFERGLYWALPSGEPSLKRAMLDHPSFTRHFEGFLVSARYLEGVTAEAAAQEAHYLNLQDTRLIVDFGDLLNHYPDISLIGNFASRQQECLTRFADVLDKAAKFRCEAVVVCPHRNAENQYTAEEAKQGFERSLAQIKAMCETRGLKLLLKNRAFSPVASQGAHGFAFDTAAALADGPQTMPEDTQLLLLSAPVRDPFGQVYAINAPLSRAADGQQLAAWYAAAQKSAIPVALTAEYASWDETFDDLQHLARA